MANETPMNPARRTVLAGAGLAGVATVITACSSGGGSSTTAAASDPATTQSAPNAGAAAPSDSSAPSSSASAGGGGGAALGAASDIPVGGGKVFADKKVVVTQPTAGQFKAFTAVCTHAGCTVSSVSNGTINCPCHGSQYHIADGTVARGPAPAALAAESISVNNGQITLS
ncbi:Rieske Fe-S protein [Streptacidiphilus sp. MAP12-16]|uniref:Rieske (2Fe-2S) protein n=1 Tax=Streptacidiphilus sp. MAP12-16 TaxID=3156300 RepID=UPI003515B8A3